MGMLKDLIDKQMEDPEFKKAWEDLEPEYLILCCMLEACDAMGLKYSDLPKVTGIRKTTLDKIWNCTANPPLRTLKKLASSLNTNLKIEFVRR